MKINKILVANRGEIACRIIRTAQKMGIECVAIYSDADQYSQHAQLANEAWHIGKSPAKESYLDGEKIIQIAKKSNANAIHPGYGFLSENADFAEACSLNNIIFIGPPTSAIKAMGSKSEAKNIMLKANVPLVQGYHGSDQSESMLQAEADKIGYPLLIKATAGGGGKGMRIVENADHFIELLNSCKRESLSSFHDDKMLIEKYLSKPRHIEIQIFADNHGNVIHLFERDCSVQRRHQKIIEEAPAPGLSERIREQMGQVAIAAAKAINYRGAGTVEFLFDEDGSFYFMEMNTRLQVEHPVTEKITGLDLVEWQIIVANNMPLPLQQNQLQITGHAFEARIYAEDPNNDFLPATGKINQMDWPNLSEHVRVDSGVVSADEVSIYYDPMIAKLIVWDKDRASALARLRGALTSFHVAGLMTNIEFLHQLASHDAFNDAELDTHFLDTYGEEFANITPNLTSDILSAAALQIMLRRSGIYSEQYIEHESPWNENSGWRLNEDNYHLIEFQYQGNDYKVTAHFRNNNYLDRDQLFKIANFLFEIEGTEYHVSGYLKQNKIHLNIDGHQSTISYSSNENKLVLFKNASNWELEVKDHSLANIEEELQPDLVAPMPGTIIDIFVNSGDTVEKGQALVVMEAMKMEHTIKAHKNMKVIDVLYEIGDLVNEGAELIFFEEE